MAEEDERLLYDLTPEEWREDWKKGELGWHDAAANRRLQENVDKLLQGNKKAKIFFPFCGKDISMKWLYDLGHVIVGVEYAPEGCEEFFKDAGIEWTKEAVEKCNGQLYKSADGRLSLYSCDFWKFSSEIESGFDAMFDRGAFGSCCAPKDRKTYADKIAAMMKQGGRIIMLLPGEEGTYGGHMHVYTTETVQEAWGHVFSVEFLGKETIYWGYGHGDAKVGASYINDAIRKELEEEKAQGKPESTWQRGQGEEAMFLLTKL